MLDQRLEKRDAMPETVLRSRHCRACTAIFYVCNHVTVGKATVAKSVGGNSASDSYVRPTSAISNAKRAVELARCVNDTIGFAGQKLA